MSALLNEAGKYFLLFATGLAIVVTVASFSVFLKQGPGRIANLRRLGLNIPNWWKGELPKKDAGSSINTIEGLQIEVENGEIRQIKQTRTISSEI